MACASAHTKVSVTLHVSLCGCSCGQEFRAMARESQVYSYNLERLSQAHREGEYCGVRGGVETLIPVEMERPEGRLEPEKRSWG